MTKRTITIAAVFALVYNIGYVHSSADVLKEMSKNFGKNIEECRKELKLNDDVLKEMMNFWNQDYVLVNRDVGCAIICLSKKLELHTDDGKLHHGNLAEFAKKHGADDDIAAKMVELLHTCEKESDDGSGDDCRQKLDMANCFRKRAMEIGWAPDFRQLASEMMAEAQALMDSQA